MSASIFTYAHTYTLMHVYMHVYSHIEAYMYELNSLLAKVHSSTFQIASVISTGTIPKKKKLWG